MELKSSNPVFGRTFEGSAIHTGYGKTMTVSGTVNRAGILMLLVALSASWVWNQFFNQIEPNAAAVSGYMLLGSIGGLIAAMVTIFKKEWSGITAPVYAVLEGLALGGFSAIMEMRFPGIAIQAVALTFGTCICMLLAYRSGLIRATDKLKMGVVAATGGIALVYIASMVLGFFNVQIPGIFGSGPIGIVFSLVVVVIAALNLILDFAVIEDGARMGAPKYMEWFAAFGLMVTLVWLYLEMVRLLSKLRDDRR
ncbi:MAG: putative rane protein [Bryobacterales bacterium]|nr:putative rane protein [Bryobacterales bacterium]